MWNIRMQTLEIYEFSYCPSITHLNPNSFEIFPIPCNGAVSIPLLLNVVVATVVVIAVGT